MTVPSFPTLAGFTYKFKRRMAFRSARHEAISGARSTVPLRSQPVWTWEIPVGFLRAGAVFGNSMAEFETLSAFCAGRISQGLAFGYTDPNDNAVVAQPFGQGDGVSVAFQLVRALGGFTQPVALATPSQVTVAGTPTSAYTVSPKGLLTFSAPPAYGAALAWTGSYQWLCMFDIDEVAFGLFMNGLYDAESISFSSLVNP